MVNYFSHLTAAQRYAQSRPYFHPIVIDRIKKALNLQDAVTTAVERGQERLEDLFSWLLDALTPFFTQPKHAFIFGTVVTYLKKDVQQQYFESVSTDLLP